MTPDQSAQIKQIEEHAHALRVDFDAAEGAGAALPAILDAKELLEEAVRKAKDSIVNRPEVLKWER